MFFCVGNDVPSLHCFLFQNKIVQKVKGFEYFNCKQRLFIIIAARITERTGVKESKIKLVDQTHTI